MLHILCTRHTITAIGPTTFVIGVTMAYTYTIQKHTIAEATTEKEASTKESEEVTVERLLT